MDRSGAAARVVRLCEAGLDSRALRAQALHELGRAVGFDAYAWLLTDPLTWVGVAPIADCPWLAELPRHIQLKYGTAHNRWTGLGSSHVALLGARSKVDTPTGLLWRDFLRGHGVGDVASVVFPDAYGCWGFLELFRDAGRGPFTAVEAALLREVVRPLTGALRRGQAACFATAPRQGRVAAGPVVLLLSPELKVLGQTPDTHDYLSLLVPPPTDRPPVPASAYNVAAQLLAVEAGVDGHPATARVHLYDDLWVTLRAARLGRPSEGRDRNIAVTIEASAPAERLDLFARAFALSARETELLGQLASGSDTRELARQLFVSQNTVQDHLKSIFAKTATRSRPGLLSRALGS